MGKENYSKEAFNETQEEIERQSLEIDKNSEPLRDSLTPYPVRVSYGKIVENARKRLHEASNKLYKLRGAGQTEATELNEEYDALLQEAQRTMGAVREFEINKLGMSADQEHDKKSE